MGNLLDILKHWNPELRKSEHNHKIYISNYCPVCKYHSYSNKRFFRYNTKLGVIKCFECGMSAKNIQSLLHQIKFGISNHCLYLTKQHKRWKKMHRKLFLERGGFEKESRCETEYESTMPF